MGNTCQGKGKKTEEDVPPPTVITIHEDGELSGNWEQSPVIQWERRQQELNEEVMEKMREEFHNRPDNFILNLLIASVQFYANYNKEKVEIRNHIRDREMAFDRKLEASKRKVLYMGGHEEISGSHILYQPREHPYMEVPTPLQFFVVHDNIDLYPESQYQELQGRQYTDLDGPGYRFCTEYSNRHPGYVRLRCVDIIPGVTRSNTYEDIYGFLKPLDESEPDPVLDPRPLRRTSLTLPTPNGPLPKGSPRLGHDSLYSDFEEGDEEEMHSSLPANPKALNGLTHSGPREANELSPAILKARRSSGVLPPGYPSGGKLRQLVTAMKAVAESSEGQNDALPNGDVGHAVPRRLNQSERRPSGVFPRVGPEMRRLRLTSPHDTTDSRPLMARRLTCVEEEEEEEDSEEEGNEGDENVDPENRTSGLNPGETLEEVEEGEEEETEKNKLVQNRRATVILHWRLNEGCFINRNIKIKDPGDAYGISTKTERRTYFSSERHVECFEDEFEDLAKVLGKEHLVDTSQRQGPAVTANELMIEEIGPKFYTEFIPTMILKEWPKCAFEWRLRDRRGKLDEEAKVVYKWPKDINIQEAMQMGCNLVPIGHYNPKEPNRVMKIEWQIQFVKAEQILLRSLGHTQMRLLLWVEYLLRDHLGDVPTLQNQHLRYILFWMCEKNFRDWQEPRLGIKLKAYLKTLYNSLSTESLPHYFVASCNMMKSIPEKYIRQTQAMVKKMKENLPVYIMHTMSRMRMAPDFYPRLNVKKLFRLVTMKSFGLEHLNPQLIQIGGGEDPSRPGQDDGFHTNSEDEDDENAEERRKLHKMRLQRQQKAAVQTTKSNKDDNNMPGQPPTIRLDTQVWRVKDLRAGSVLKIFGRHFLAMARASNRHRAYPQAYTYLLLAGNIATLLDETGNNDHARTLRSRVEQLNVASRGGVRDMIGSSWSVNEQYDLVPSATPPRGSNWELSKLPPSPLAKRSPRFGVHRTQTAPALRNLTSGIPEAALETPLTPDTDTEINELPTDSPSSPQSPYPFPLSTDPEPAPLPVQPPLTNTEESSSAPQPEPTDPAPLPVQPPLTHTEESSSALQPEPTDTPAPSLSIPAAIPADGDVPDAAASQLSNSTPNFLNLREDDTDEGEDESTDF